MSDKPKRSGKTSRTARIRPEDYVAAAPKMPVTHMPHLPWPSALSPSGLVPSLCNHGLKSLPPDHPPVARTPRLDPVTRGELPYIGNSWVRARYVLTTMKCVVCGGAERPDDFVVYRT